MNPYLQLINQSTKKTSHIIRDMPSAKQRMIVMERCRQYHTILREIEKDYPNATIQEIKTTVVNRLRHADVYYREAMRGKTSKRFYTDLFLYTMDTISLSYPWIADEVVKQIEKKTKNHDINTVEKSEIYSFNMRDYISATVFTNKHIKKCFA